MPDPLPAHPAALPKGRRIAEYEIVRVLGAGGFGITYLAFDHQLNGPVALKEYFPAELATRVDGERVAATAPTNQETFAWGLERFLDEARAIHRFRHPNVVQARRYLEANGTAYIVMEYVEGESLKSILDRRGRLSAEEWRPWMDALLDGLEHVHSHNYLHRDVKPANIVVRAATGEPVLVDFGSARAQQRDRTHTQVLTAGYAPIEQYSGGGGGQGPPSDIYALAALSHRVLTGNAVPSAPDRVLNDDYEPLAESVSSADPTWMAAIDQALALRPQNRPQTVEAWRVALGAAQSGATRGEAPPPIRPVRTGSRHWWWAVPALFTLSIVILRLASGPPGSTPTPAATLDVNEQPFSETIHLSPGFTPHPRIVAVRGGGAINVSYLAGNCVGFAATGPDVRLHWSGASDLLGIAFRAEDREADASLIVNLPDGSWICDDDSGDGLDPLIAISAPPEGQYDIWVGAHTGSPPYLPGELLIGEASGTAGATPPSPPAQAAGVSDQDQDGGRGQARRPTAPAATLDVNEQPFSETVYLSHGFTPSPRIVAVRGGGGINVSYLDGNCVGFAAPGPDVRLHWSGASNLLGIAFHAEDREADASLIVNLPDGSWTCDDDSGDGLDPLIAISAPPEGQYDIWVGTHTSSPPYLPGELLIGEASGTAGATPPSPPAQAAGVSDQDQDGGRGQARRPTAPAATLDVNEQPFSETVYLSHGFTPSPRIVAVRGGGGINVSYLDGNCVGFAAPGPEVRLHWSGTSELLGIAFRTEDGEADVSLIVNLPDGSWICDDDSGDGLDPLIAISAPPEGQYDIWVGTHTGSPLYLPSELLIGEASTTENPATSSRPSRTAQREDDQPRARWFTRGSHQDDVLRVQGTPTSIRRFDILGHETWSYGNSSVTISTRTRQVLDWSNHGGQLKVRLPPGDSGTDLPYFSRGSHQDDVLRIQGTPTSIRRFDILGHETWSYGNSSVTISTRTRQVLDWSNHGGQLKVRLPPGDSGTDLPYFSRGSHQDDVLRIQGTPTSIRRFDILGHETWSYGNSSVTISTRTRQVLDWSNHGGQLKVRLPPGDSGTDLPYFSRGSHQDDVLRIQGTPTSIRRFDILGHETWSYGNSSVTISTRTRQVLDWSNHGGQLKVRLSGQR